MTTGRNALFSLIALALAAVTSAANAGYTSQNDPHGFPPGCTPGCSGAAGSSGGTSGAAGGTGGAAGGGDTTPAPGMPVYGISPMLISLTLNDTPLSYKPAVGPALDFSVSYNQLDIDQPSSFSYSNVGPKWTFNWLEYVQDDPRALGSDKTLVYLESGPGRLYSGYNSSAGTFAPEPETGAQLVLISSNPVAYERRLSDGSKEVFAEDDGSAGYPRRVFLTRRIDAHGNAVDLSYDDSHRVTAVSDSKGHSLTFEYLDPRLPRSITDVKDAFGRTVSLEYDAGGRLAAITDAIGLRSSFGYDGSGTNVSSLQTPYGTTKFSRHQSGTRRWIDILDANGYTSRMEFNQAVPGVPFSESQVPQGIKAFNRYINSRDTFYWDAQAFSEAPGNYSKSTIYHWTHKTLGGRLSSVTADALESVKFPLESRIWYNHPNDIAGGSGTLNMPSVIARVLPDGSTQITRNAYDAQGRLIQSIDPAGLQTDYTYAANGVDLLKVERHGPDGYSAVETWSYDNKHRVLSHTDETGGTTSFTYNEASQVLTQTDAVGGVNHYTYDAEGNRTAWTDASGNTTHYEYDALGRMTREIDPLGHATTYSYDALNRLVRKTFPDGTYESTTWDKLDKVAVRDRNGGVTTFAYDALRHLTSETDPLGNTKTWSYFPNGLLKSTTDANGHTTTWDRDLEGRVVAVTGPLGGRTTYAYDSAGRRVLARNALGQTTTYSYDKSDRLARTTDPNGVSTDFFYTSRGWIAKSSRRSGAAPGSTVGAMTTFQYNAHGDRILAVDPDGVTSHYTYDAAHRLIAEDDGMGDTRVNTLDALGHVLDVAYAASGSPDVSWLYSKTYDAAGNVVREEDGEGNGTVFTYDADGRVQEVVDPRGIVSKASFDPMGNLIEMARGDSRQSSSAHGHGAKVNKGTSSLAIEHRRFDAANRLVSFIDPDGLETRYSYDPMGQKVAQVSPDTGTTTYAYDAGGDLIRTVNAGGVETDFTFDITGRKVASHHPSDPSNDIAFYYDEPNSVTGCDVSYPIGHPTRIVKNSDTSYFCYDDSGQVVAQRQLIKGQTYLTKYRFTPGGRVASVQYPSGSIVSYSYDTAGRPQSVQLTSPQDGSVSTIVKASHYLPFGPADHIAYGDGTISVARTYDRAYRGLTLRAPGMNVDFARDPTGNIAEIRSGEKRGGPERFKYDALQRLEAVVGSAGYEDSRYRYNSTGDRVWQHVPGGAPLEFAYELGTHHLASIANPGAHGAIFMSTSPAGNLTRIPSELGDLRLAYDADNRLASVLGPDGPRASYTYDGLGYRAAKVLADGTETDYVWQGNHILGEYAHLGGGLREYVWFGDELVASLDSEERAAVHFVFNDFLDTPRVVTDLHGAPVWSWPLQGNAFGTLPARGPYTFNFRYPGQYLDTESGLFYNLNRYYAPALGRYVESDPVGLRAGSNTYAYVSSNPINNTDPLGLAAFQLTRQGPGDAVGGVYCGDFGKLGIWLSIPDEVRCPAIGVCLEQHEKRHIAQVERDQPGLCSWYNPNTWGMWVGYGSTLSMQVYEDDAYLSEKSCLESYLRSIKCHDEKCQYDIKSRISDIDNYILPRIANGDY